MHIEGMLDRDQRTVLTTLRTNLRCDRTMYDSSFKRYNVGDVSKVTATNSTTTTTTTTTAASDLNVSQTTSLEDWTRRMRKSRTIWRFVQRLKRVLIVCVYLASVIYLPRGTYGAPTSRIMADRMNSHPKWINPCGSGVNEMMAHDGEAIMVSDRDLLSQIIIQANIALSAANDFKTDFVEKTMKTDYETNHNTWKAHRYDWLPNRKQIPKDLDENIPDEDLKELELDKSLLDTYEYLQTIAVGLEQIVWDQEDEEGPFYARFKETEFKLRAVLCEIQVAILEHSLDMRPDVTRDIMTEAYRTNMKSRALRDWLLFRDYMNALQYVIQVFEHLKDTL